MCVYCLLSDAFPCVLTAIKTQRDLATVTGRVSVWWREPQGRQIRAKMRGLSLPGRATDTRISPGVWRPFRYIYLACSSISLVPVKSCSQTNVFFKAGIDDIVKSQREMWKDFFIFVNFLLDLGKKGVKRFFSCNDNVPDSTHSSLSDICFHPCPFVCLYIFKVTQKTTGWIATELGGRMCRGQSRFH